MHGALSPHRGSDYSIRNRQQRVSTGLSYWSTRGLGGTQILRRQTLHNTHTRTHVYRHTNTHIHTQAKTTQTDTHLCTHRHKYTTRHSYNRHRGVTLEHEHRASSKMCLIIVVFFSLIHSEPNTSAIFTLSVYVRVCVCVSYNANSV